MTDATAVGPFGPDSRVCVLAGLPLCVLPADDEGCQAVYVGEVDQVEGGHAWRLLATHRPTASLTDGALVQHLANAVANGQPIDLPRLLTTRAAW